MKNNWKKCKLGDTSIEIIDGDRGKQYPKNNELLPDGFCLFLSTKNLPDIHFDFSETQFISREKDCALRKGKLQRNDIVFTTRGTLGHLAWFTNAIPYDNIRINSGMVILRNQDAGIDTRFLFQQLTSQYIQKQIAELRTGSAQPQLPIKDFLNLELSLPPVEEQKRIADILGAFDDKIELLQKQNKTLEEMAKAIFKSWFVDFDVVKAKQRGDSKADVMREYHLTEELYNLFPSSFEDSSLGPIPSGWEVKAIGSLVDVVRGGSPRPIQKFLSKEGLPWLKISDATASQTKFITHIEQCIIPEGLNKTRLIKKGSLVVSNSATPGIPKILALDTCIHDGWLFLDNYNGISKELLYYFIWFNRKKLISLGSGSVFTNLKTEVLKNFCIVTPAAEFQNQINPIFMQLNSAIENHNKQIQTLTELRDSLLPRLISGKIRV